MVKLFKNALAKVLSDTRRLPSLIELQTFTSDAIRIVNDRPLTALSDVPNDISPLTPASFLGQQLAPNTPMGSFHDKGNLRKDFLFNATWMTGYLPTLQGRNKWRVTQKNLTPGQLVLLGDAEDVFHRGAYRLGRIHCVHPKFVRVKSLYAALLWLFYPRTRLLVPAI